MNIVYNFDMDTPGDIIRELSANLKKRRLEKNLSRKALSEFSGVPAPTIAKFESVGKISLESYVALCKALGYTTEVKALLSEPKYSTMQELDTINRNKGRKRGRYEIDK